MIFDLDAFATGRPRTLEVEHVDCTTETILPNEACSAQQIDWFRVGSALNLVKQQQ